MTPPKLSIAYFVTSHGFGHAARASAVMNAIGEQWPFVRFEIFTQTPRWFFEDSLSVAFAHHEEATDVGLLQRSPFRFDADQTLDALDLFLPFDETLLESLADQLHRLDCHLVICDISPLGIAAARKAGIASVLVENFTWDWIYESYQADHPRFGPHIAFLKDIFDSADMRIQTAPVCFPNPSAQMVHPVSREPKTTPFDTRRRLGIGPSAAMVVITLGGIPETVRFADALKKYAKPVIFVVPGAAPDIPEKGQTQGNILLLPRHSGFYHPDLIAAADAVVGKLGYSTLAEVYHAGVPFGYIPRSDFRESPVFEAYIQESMTGLRIPEADFYSGEWLSCLPDLLALPKERKNRPNGALAAAAHICRFLASEKEIIEVVDRTGRILGAAPRDCVHGDNRMLHRVVHVLVFDDEGRLLLQKRSQEKKVAPGRWDTSVGGHVDCGEAVEAAMLREMEEELGIRPASPPCYAYQYIHTNDVESELVFTYICRYTGPVRHNLREIDAVKFWTMDEIGTALGSGLLSDNFEDEMQRYRRWHSRQEAASAGEKEPDQI